MTKGSKIVSDEIIAVTVRHPELKEVPITQMTANNLKNNKRGLFQNELNYNILFPNIKPNNYSSFTNQTYRADLVGYLNDGFVLTEFKIFDEKRPTKNPWGVLFYFEKDWRKLEEARRKNKGKLHGTLLLVFAIRNTLFTNNQIQIDQMVKEWRENEIGESKRPSINNPKYYPILFVIKEHIKYKSKSKWEFTFYNEKNTAFMIATSIL